MVLVVFVDDVEAAATVDSSGTRHKYPSVNFPTGSSEQLASSGPSSEMLSGAESQSEDEP
jgi:hypothetical protein